MVSFPRPQPKKLLLFLLCHQAPQSLGASVNFPPLEEPHFHEVILSHHPHCTQGQPRPKSQPLCLREQEAASPHVSSAQGREAYVHSSPNPTPQGPGLVAYLESGPKILGLRLPVANVASSYLKTSGFWHVHPTGNHMFNLYGMICHDNHHILEVKNDCESVLKNGNIPSCRGK